MIELKTNRLLIRDHIAADLSQMHELYSSPEEMRYLLGLKSDCIEETQHKLAEALNEAKAVNRVKYFFAILEICSGSYLGEIGYTLEQTSDSGSTADLGYFIKKQFWSMGFITEAGQAVIEDAFNNRNIKKVTAGCFLENRASEKVMIKLGFKKKKNYNVCALHEGQLKARLRYSVFRSDYLASHF